MAVRRRVHLRLCAGALLLSLPIAATSTSPVVGAPAAPTPSGAASRPQPLTVSAFSGLVVTSASQEQTVDADKVARQLVEAGRQDLSAASPTRPDSLGGLPEDLDIPDTALVAYMVAASTMTQADPDCGVHWALLAAIGRVETDHGRYAGAELRPNGVSTPLIRGVALNGKGPVSAIRDTDGGRLDGDKRWDRAVGPMQFLPSTWAYAGVDADGDGRRSPDDLNDAALAAAVYLCAAPGDLDSAAGARRAVYRYNPSDAYVDLVLDLTRAYRSEGLVEPPTETTTLALGATRVGPAGGSTGSAPDQDGGTTGSTNGSTNDGDTGGDGPHGNGKSDGPGNGTGDGDGKDDRNGDAHLEDPVQALPGVDDEEQLPGGGGGKDGPGGPGGEPTPSPDPEPTDGPDPDPEPVLLEVAGVLTVVEDVLLEDGSTEDQWYLTDPLTGDAVMLDVGDEEWLAEPALADHDADETLETNLEELTGLVDLEVVVLLEEDTDPAVLHAINDEPYLLVD